MAKCTLPEVSLSRYCYVRPDDDSVVGQFNGSKADLVDEFLRYFPYLTVDFSVEDRYIDGFIDGIRNPAVLLSGCSDYTTLTYDIEASVSKVFVKYTRLIMAYTEEDCKALGMSTESMNLKIEQYCAGQMYDVFHRLVQEWRPCDRTALMVIGEKSGDRVSHARPTMDYVLSNLKMDHNVMTFLARYLYCCTGDHKVFDEVALSKMLEGTQVEGLTEAMLLDGWHKLVQEGVYCKMQFESRGKSGIEPVFRMRRDELSQLYATFKWFLLGNPPAKTK